MSENQSNIDKGLPWHAWGCMMIAFFIPFAKKFVPGFIVLLGIYAVVCAFRKKKIGIRTFNISFILLLTLFGLHLFGLFFSNHIDEGINEIGIKLSLAAFPLLAWLLPNFSAKNYSYIQSAFVAGCLSFIPLAVGYGFYRSIQFNDFGYLSYQQLGIYLHPTYAATYEAMGFFILLHRAAKSKFLFHRKFIHYALASLMLIFISMLASKAGFIAALISIAMGVYILLKKKMSIREPILVALISCTVLFGSAYLLPGISTRVEAAVEDVENSHAPDNAMNQAEAKSSTQLRWVTWRASWQLICEHPLGVGTGNTKYELIKKYEAAGENYAAEKTLNAHNQFLQTGAELGWPGLIVLLCLLFVLAYRSMKLNDMLILNFLLLCAMNFLFESFLEVQAGIVFFCFWIMVFIKERHAKSQLTSS